MQAFPLGDWLAPVFGEPEEAEHVVAPLTIGIALVVVMLIGALPGLAVRRPPRGAGDGAGAGLVRDRGPRATRSTPTTINESLFMRPGQWLTRALVFFDNRGVDGAVNGLAATLGGSSSRLGRTQTGFVRTYALGMLGGAVLVAGALLAVTAG